jgi:hypothetical protein
VRRLALFPLIALAGCGSTAVADAGPNPAFDQADRAHPPEYRGGRYLTAIVRRATWLRARPGGRRLHRLSTRTEFGSRRVLGVVRRKRGWLQVISSRLPNDRLAWIEASDATVRGTDFDIVVDRSERRAELRHGGVAIRAFRVAVGRRGNETPLGTFAVTDKLHPVDPGSPYGCCAIALSGRQTRVDPSWVGGNRLAIHGTPDSGRVGRPASLGCLEAQDGPLRAVLRHVPLGTPVFVRA